MSPWLALIALGAFHGANPAMGWLFAVALGLHRGRRSVVWLSLLPIAAGHALSVAAVVLALLLFGFVVNMRAVEIAGAMMLVGMAGYHLAFGHKGRVRIGMTTGMGGLALWSFLMATAHGAGLMMIPAVLPLCLAASPARELTAAGSLPISLAAVGVHMAAMLAVTAMVAGAVHQWIGVGFLRRGWVNLDLFWSLALLLAAAVLIF